jgi:hypothetical protein
MCMAVTLRGHERRQECAWHRIAISLAARPLTAPPSPARPYGVAQERVAVGILLQVFLAGISRKLKARSSPRHALLLQREHHRP